MLHGNPHTLEPAALRVPASIRSHRGFTLIELILVRSVGSMISLLSFQDMKRDTESNQARSSGN